MTEITFAKFSEGNLEFLTNLVGIETPVKINRAVLAEYVQRGFNEEDFKTKNPNSNLIIID